MKGIIIRAERSLDPDRPVRYWELMESQQVRCICLDELSAAKPNSLG
ncbi:MAG: Rpn family recombination-promoting nuclease/putative transposase [Leptolyngbyaceae cyanobacterium HOT.MB2.61]|nr:Rpn family recombination-promoting nuclease/putative transposase [Leptolyngbyaceae cyanobacterium HOT.MB2.61]